MGNSTVRCWKVVDKFCQPRHVRSVIILFEEIAQDGVLSSAVGVLRRQHIHGMDTQVILLTIDRVLRGSMEMELCCLVGLHISINLHSRHGLFC